MWKNRRLFHCLCANENRYLCEMEGYICIITCIIALIGHLDGGGASTFCIVIPAMLPVYKKMHMRTTTLLTISVLAMGILNLMPWAGLHGRLAEIEGEVSFVDEKKTLEENELARPKLFVFNLLLTVGVIALLIKDFFPSYVPFMIGVGLAIVVNYPGCKTAEASD